ncbi:MAG: DNA-binding domain-containing protein [Polyangiaceae bacterium]|nr:DNA-binding domain-containing protein [Polyangiaceae bacterium]
MTDARRAPAWLAAFQGQFGAALRTPLSPETGTLRPDPSAYAPALCEGVSARGGPHPGAGTEGASRLATYNRQYWFRLFRTLQGEFPLTARLLGLWRFNRVAQAFLLARPPRHADLRQAADGFAEALAAALAAPDASPTSASLATALAAPPGPAPNVPQAALEQAVRIDEAWRTIWAAPEQPAWRPGADDLPRFARPRPWCSKGGPCSNSVRRSPATRARARSRSLWPTRASGAGRSAEPRRACCAGPSSRPRRACSTF